MTRTQHLNACIEAMADTALAGKVIYADVEKPHVLEFSRENWIEIMTAAIYALPKAGARVVPIEATPEMIAAAWRVLNSCGENCLEKYGTGPAVREAYVAMSAAGDLTNPTETKP